MLAKRKQKKNKFGYGLGGSLLGGLLGAVLASTGIGAGLGASVVSGIVCKKCGKTLPDMLAVDHLDPNFPVNKCPHTPTYKIEW